MCREFFFSNLYIVVRIRIDMWDGDVVIRKRIFYPLIIAIFVNFGFVILG